MSERLAQHEENSEKGLSPVTQELRALETMEAEGSDAREELLKAFGESDEEVNVESIDELRAILQAAGIPDAEIERQLSETAE